jgi:hypothetical protein
MADTRDTTPTKVTLDKRRPYRVNDTDRDAVWVGPGEVEVPLWVAQHWGLVKGQQAASTPATRPASTPNDKPAQDTVAGARKGKTG